MHYLHNTKIKIVENLEQSMVNRMALRMLV